MNASQNANLYNFSSVRISIKLLMLTKAIYTPSIIISGVYCFTLHNKSSLLKLIQVLGLYYEQLVQSVLCVLFCQNHYDVFNFLERVIILTEI